MFKFISHQHEKGELSQVHKSARLKNFQFFSLFNKVVPGGSSKFSGCVKS